MGRCKTTLQQGILEHSGKERFLGLMCHCWGLETCIFVSNQSLVFSSAEVIGNLRHWVSSKFGFLKPDSPSFTFCYKIWHLVGLFFLSIMVSDNSTMWYFGLAGTSGGCKSKPPGWSRGTSRVSPGSGVENLQGQGWQSSFSAWTPRDPSSFCSPQGPRGAEHNLNFAEGNLSYRVTSRISNTI